MCSDDAKFFEHFDACFRRNSIWSVKHPFLDPVDGVKKSPLLGDANTDMKEVDAFYKFWTNFESWRVFDHFAKHNIEAIKQAGDRYQKRKMEKENTDECKVHAKAEHKRLIELVETARKWDPRIQAAEANQANAKNAVKEAAAKKKADEKAAVAAAKKALTAEADAKKAAE